MHIVLPYFVLCSVDTGRCITEKSKVNLHVQTVFQVQDLAVASPATVSRCGMVYIDPDDLKWMPHVQTWITGLGPKVLLL